jgi:hypothetical protein
LSRQSMAHGPSAPHQRALQGTRATHPGTPRPIRNRPRGPRDPRVSGPGPAMDNDVAQISVRFGGLALSATSRAGDGQRVVQVSIDDAQTPPADSAARESSPISATSTRSPAPSSSPAKAPVAGPAKAPTSGLAKAPASGLAKATASSPRGQGPRGQSPSRRPHLGTCAGGWPQSLGPACASGGTGIGRQAPAWVRDLADECSGKDAASLAGWALSPPGIGRLGSRQRRGSGSDTRHRLGQPDVHCAPRTRVGLTGPGRVSPRVLSVVGPEWNGAFPPQFHWPRLPLLGRGRGLLHCRRRSLPIAPRRGRKQQAAAAPAYKL